MIVSGEKDVLLGEMNRMRRVRVRCGLAIAVASFADRINAAPVVFEKRSGGQE